MKTYEAQFKPGQTKGVYGISLVEKPAMEGHFIALSENTTIQLKTINEEERLLIGLVLEPNKPVYRNQDGEEFNVLFTADTIKELAFDFYRNSYHTNSSLEHTEPIEGVTFVESWLVEDSKIDKSAALGLSYPKGSWLATMKVDSEEVWNDYVKGGKVKGFSVDALVSLKEINFKSHIKMSDNTSISEAITKGFENFMAMFKKEPVKVDLGAVKTASQDADIQFEGDTLEVGGRVWLNAEDGTEVALPVGEYELEDKRILVVTEEGKVAEVKEAAAEEPAPAPAEPAQMSKETSEAIAQAVKSVMIKYHEAANKENEALKKELETIKGQVIELSGQEAAKPVKAVPVQAAANTARGRIFETIQELN